MKLIYTCISYRFEVQEPFRVLYHRHPCTRWSLAVGVILNDAQATHPAVQCGASIMHTYAKNKNNGLSTGVYDCALPSQIALKTFGVLLGNFFEHLMPLDEYWPCCMLREIGWDNRCEKLQV